MPTFYVEDYDGPRDDETPAPAKKATADAKVISSSSVEDKAVKKSASTAKKS